MRYDGLTQDYWQSRKERIDDTVRSINARARAPQGRVIPEDDDLVIGAGRRLPVAVMFLDICGFSERLSNSQQEQLAILRALNLFFSEMVHIAHDYGGAVEKNTGDGLLAHFEDGGGDPPAPGSTRAVAAAMTMVATNDAYLTPVFEGANTQPIVFRISIDYGPVTIARVGTARGFNANVAIGSTANFASKMLRHAGPGDIVLGGDAKLHLPAEWAAYAQILLPRSGWVRPTVPELPYPLYRFVGQWSQLL